MREEKVTKEDTRDDAPAASEGTKLYRKNSREQNTATIRECIKRNPHYKKMRESIQKRFGLDIADSKAFPVTKPGFSWKKAEEKFSQMREAEHSSGWTQVLRAGVQTVVNSLYETVPTTFEDWVHVVQSARDTELYAPLHGIAFPSEVPQEGLYPEAKALGLDIKLKNRKYGEIFPVTKELLDDDQTGQFQNQVGLIAEYLKQVLEVLSYGKLASVSGAAYSNLTVPVSETQPTEEATYPWSTSFVGGGANRPVAFGALSQANIQNGIIALANQKNKLGLKMGVSPSRLLASHYYRFDSAVLLNSAYYPSGAAAAGNTGGAFAINPIKGILDATYSRFMFDNTGVATATSKAWYIVDDSKPWFIVQIREAASVTQENPESGESFNRDVVRFKGKTRCNADFIDPRFAWQGSDGSA